MPSGAASWTTTTRRCGVAVRTHVIHEHLRAHLESPPLSLVDVGEVMAARPAHQGDWAGGLAAFDRDRQINGLGVDSWAPDRAATDPEDLVLQVELEASRREPYRRLSRLFHLIGRAT